MHEKPHLTSPPFGGRPPWRVLALPYTASSHPYDPVAFVNEYLDVDDPVLVVGHLVVEGVDKGDESGEMARGRDVRFPLEAIESRVPAARRLMINGHHHRRQIHKGIYIPGSLARLRFGPDALNVPGAWLLETPW